MDTSKVLSLLEQLDDELDDLEESLDPLIQASLSDSSSKLPLLDKAKLYVLATYAIESTLFSYLRLNGVKARQHPVFTELTRVKQYFEKIKAVENPIDKRQNLSLDKSAASRMIKAGLVGNDRYDLERAEQQAKERARAHIKFGGLSEKMKQDELSKKRKAEGAQTDSSESSSESDSSTKAVSDDTESSKVPEKKRKLEQSIDSTEPLSNLAVSSTSGKSKVKKKKSKKSEKSKKQKKNKLSNPDSGL